MPVFAVITENDESMWSDDTGTLYHFPKRYLKHLEPGTQVVYYKGKLKKKEYRPHRLSDDPHYFGTAVIGKTYADRSSEKGDLFAVIEQYEPFMEPVLAKSGEGYIETIPESRKSNYWRDGVRVISESTYRLIVSGVEKGAALPVESQPNPPTNDVDLSFESTVIEGAKKKRFVTQYERNPKLRKQAIAIHGDSCIACGFNFGETYGEYADGFIHVHHVLPVSDFTAPKEVSPETDLVPLCANCHSVVHRKKEQTLSIEQLKALLSNA